ncbi:hypothetical protein [Heliophilum fasciatum]|nr:hypothetical protein [Heliophilum fasciatum]MCW2279509.1 hypothetical protein [Heliophilum fasciatum]
MFDNYVGTYKQLINSFKASGITGDVEWFAQNPNHPIAKIRDLFEKKIANTVGKGSTFSIRKVYIELQRAPYGMKYNVLSAFVLGFVLKDIVARGYQWDNNQKTGPLDVETLAAMIEEVVKDDGNDKIKLEKLICRLSKEEKAFIEKAPAMFGASSAGASGRVEDALLLIQNRVEKISGRVPLWVLTEYLESVNEPQVAIIKHLLDNICLAGSTSSKSGKSDDRLNAIKDVGRIILENSDIITTISGYMKPENFVAAFQIYVDKNAPTLKALAESVGDVSCGYCQAIKEKAAESAGLLWNKNDIASEIAETEQEYEVIKLLKPIIGFEEFVSYRTAVDTLRNAVISTNKLPKTLIESAFPMLSVFLSNLGNNGNASAIKESLSQSIDVIKKLFFDVTRAKSLELLKLRLNGVTISDKELLDIYNGLSSGFTGNEATFLNDLRSRIEEYAKESVVQNLKEEWKRFSDENTPSEWANNVGIPARYLFDGISEANDIISAVQTPGAFSSDKLGELLDVLKGLSSLSIAECQSRFIADIVPKRYVKLNINLPALLDFLRSKYGTQPNNWQTKPDIQEFIRSQYKGAFAPQVTEKIKKTSPDLLKQKLLQLAQDNPELGLLFWE